MEDNCSTNGNLPTRIVVIRSIQMGLLTIFALRKIVGARVSNHKNLVNEYRYLASNQNGNLLSLKTQM